jgi:glutamate synthase (NADPH/NADH) small chain
MPDPKGFLTHRRAPAPERDPAERVKDHGEIYGTMPSPEIEQQAARCMGCGVPFCNDGCPLGNLIPDWNDLVRQDRWREAIDQLHATNNFPEFTGLVCPAPCESACVLDINDDAVTIKSIEWAIIDRAFEEGWVVAKPPATRTGLTVGVVGSGPAGLAAAAELNQVGHEVTVYERDEAPGGLVRFGVPDAKLEKWIVDRRVKVLEEEGIKFEYGADVGSGSLPIADLRERHDAIVLAIGSRVSRDLEAPGRELGGVHFAMDYLYQRNRWVANQEEWGVNSPPPEHEIAAAGKNVIVIGGGDTGMDCISNANREGATSATLLDVYPEVPVAEPLISDPDRRGRPRYPDTPWPLQPRRSETTYALDEGGKREFGRQVVELLDDGNGNVKAVSGREVTGNSSRNLQAVAGSEFVVPAELVLIAIGFSHPEHEGAVADLGLALDSRGNIKAPAFSTSRPGVFAAGDGRIGQSLIVTAIAEGRRCARVVDAWLRRPVVREPEYSAIN